jgi:hypothetical protein
MRSALFLILAFCCSFARADLLIIQHLNEIRTNSNLFAASAMVYFNPKDRTPDERSLTAAFGALVVMDTKITQVDNPPAMRDAYEEMNTIFKKLEKTKRRDSAIFPENILRILQLNKQVQTAVNEQYKAEEAVTPSPVTLLNDQGEDISSLLMDYQLRRYPLDDAEKAPFRMDIEQMPALDKKIDQNFKVLLEKRPQNADYLEPAYKNYRFVRKQLLQSKGRPNGGAEFYMTRTVIDLNDLGAELAIEALGLDPENPQDR